MRRLRGKNFHLGSVTLPCTWGSARKQCIFGLSESRFPHLRVMGRNIRFLKSELEPFRAQFKQEIGNGKT